tara:strand:+ start:165 stop:683 length:519 start_codon:yes stop_codon:yes gene_type:complete
VIVKIYQRGGIKRHAIIKEAAKYYAAWLMDGDLVDELTVNIRVCKAGLGSNDMGVCTSPNVWDSEKRSFDIRLRSSLSTYYMLKTLAHEMVHVKQFATNQLTGWHSATWNNVDFENTPYRIQPWEQEAFELEGTMLKDFWVYLRNKVKRMYSCWTCGNAGHNSRTCRHRKQN